MDELHSSVLLEEIRGFFKEIKGSFVDATLGCGGHSYSILKDNPNVNLIGIDRDINSINEAKKRLNIFNDRISIIESRFSKGIELVDFSDVSAILADIGISSMHVDDVSRGFSFNSDTLDMRMGHNSISAFDVINRYSVDELRRVLVEYGEIKNYKYYTDIIMNARKRGDIVSSNELFQLFKNLKSKGNKNPLTKFFQAIRIEVNDELNELSTFLSIVKERAHSDTIIAIITFHSLEDRIVKHTFRDWSKNCICPINIDRCNCGGDNSIGKVLTKRAIVPNSFEINKNYRSRSSKLRVFKFKKQ